MRAHPVRVPVPSLGETEKLWKHKFAIYTFQLTLANPKKKVEPPEDQEIRGFVKEIFEEEISTRKQDVTRLESALVALTRLRRNKVETSTHTICFCFAI